MKNKPDFEAFSRWVLDQFYDSDCSGVDIDGGTLQEKACEFGVMKRVSVTEPCCEFCPCAEFIGNDGIPAYCYRPNF